MVSFSQKTTWEPRTWLIVSLGVDSPFFSSIVLFKAESPGFFLVFFFVLGGRGDLGRLTRCLGSNKQAKSWNGKRESTPRKTATCPRLFFPGSIAKGSSSKSGCQLHLPTSHANLSRVTSPAYFSCQLFESYFTCQLLMSTFRLLSHSTKSTS